MSEDEKKKAVPFVEGVPNLLSLLEKRIAEGTITASEQLNYIRLLKESGHIWYNPGVPTKKPITDGVPFDEEGEDHSPLPFPVSKVK
jgi:hypothetical protein